jgi:hypothetical protein
VEVDETDTIGVVKDKVASVKADLPASRQKLIHAGKVLKDETPLNETGITENDFIVCMVTKEAAKVNLLPLVILNFFCSQSLPHLSQHLHHQHLLWPPLPHPLLRLLQFSQPLHLHHNLLSLLLLLKVMKLTLPLFESHIFQLLLN